MKFQFNVQLNDNHYLDYNVFWMTRSPYGKKQFIPLRILPIVIFTIYASISLIGGGFSAENILALLPMAILFSLYEIFLVKFFILILKLQMKSLKKSGKMGYSPKSVIEFSDVGITETTDDGKIEHKYTALERVSIIDGKIIYIHINNVMSYMLPYECFESQTQYSEFITFIKTKCEKVDNYK